MNTLKRAQEIEKTFRVANGIYVLGSLEKGVTAYSQQVRAHNLAWALWEASTNRKSPQKIAVVGGGIGGLTVTAALGSLFKNASIKLFEKRWELCPLQLGSDNRWLHPRIYEWPREGSRAPSATLPVLTWSEGRASDVARQILKGFSSYADRASNPPEIYIGVSHLTISSKSKRIEWIGTKAKFVSGLLEHFTNEGTDQVFDKIIIVGGFGLETGHTKFGITSYWRNEQLAQPALNGTRNSYIVSGFGDGAIVDICRLTISQFRQDTILYDLFGASEIEKDEELIRAERRKHASTWDFLQTYAPNLQKPLERISKRLRKDTRVTAHFQGKDNNVKSIADVIDGNSSFLNRFLLYLLYRSGAYSISFSDLEATVIDMGVSPENVLCRYGTDPLAHIISFFSDRKAVQSSLNKMNQTRAQSAERLWFPGCFPPC